MKSRPALTYAAATAAFLLFSFTSQAQVFTAVLNGANENPPNASAGTGFTTVTFSLQTHTLQVQVNFTGLTGTTSAAHIHAPATPPANSGVATQTPTFSGFPLGVTSGSYNMTFDTTLSSTWNASYITANGGTPAGAEAAFATALNNGQAYLNIHTSAFGGGEIRGFLVPEPATFRLLAVGLLGATALAFRKRRPRS